MNTPTIFNQQLKNFSHVIKELTYNDAVRTLFLTRITAIHLRALSKSQVLKDSICKTIYHTLDQLRRYDHTILGNIGGEKEKLWCKELKKDKIYDIGNLIDSLANIQESSYEDHIGLLTSWIEAVVSLQKKNRKVDTRKYKALFRYLLEEMKAESQGGETSVSYEESTGQLHFKLVQPNSHVPVHPTI